MRIATVQARIKAACLSLVIATLLVFTQASIAGQVTLLAPRDDTRVDFEKMGLRVVTFSQDQLQRMDKQTAINLGQSIDASLLVLTGARMSSEALNSLFKADEIRAAFDDLFRRGGCLFIGQLSGGGMNDFSPQMRDYFERKSLYLPQGHDRPTTSQTIGHFTAHANPDWLKLPLLSKPNSLAKGDWAGVANNVFYWQNFPENVMPILTGSDKQHPVMLLQKDILGNGTFILSQARELTRMERSEFWENLVAQLNQTDNGNPNSKPVTDTAAKPASKPAAKQGESRAAVTGKQVDIDDAAGLPLLFLKSFKSTSTDQIDESNAFTDTRIWEEFEPVSMRIYNTGKQPQKATEARLGVIGDKLIAAFVCQEPDTKNIVAKVSARDGEVWTDDSVELVLVPEKGGAVHHWLVSSKGVIYDARDRISAWNSNATAHVKIQDNAWLAVVVIPLTDMFEDGVVPELFFANLARQERGLLEISSWVSPIQAIPTAKSTGYISSLDPRVLASRLVGKSMHDAPKTTGKGYDIWQLSAWSKELSLSTKPVKKAVSVAPAIDLHMPKGGTDATVLMVRNNGAHSLVFKVNPPRVLTTPSGPSVAFTDVVTLYRGVPRLSSYETLGFDPLEALGNSSLLTVAPGETAMLWVDATARGIAAGQYQGVLSLLPITIKDQTAVSVRMDIRVRDVQIPSQLPLDVYTWGPYMGSLREHGGPADYIQLAVDSHINTFHALYPLDAIRKGPQIATDGDAYLSNIATFLNQKTKVRFVYSYHLFSDFDAALKNAGFQGQPMDEQWQKFFLTWFGQWMKALESQGVSYDDFWVQIVDEPRSNAIPDLVARSSLLKKHFPKVRTMVTIAPWGTMDDLKALAPYIDLWVPESRRLLMRETAAQELDFYKKQGAYWPYRCAQQMDMQPLISYYRHRGIQEYVLGAKGFGLWAFNSSGGDTWAQWDTPRADGSNRFDEVLVYRGEHGPVPSIRLFAFRAGIEDYVLMDLLAKAGKGASNQNKKRLLQLAEQAEALLEVTDPEPIEQWRRTTLEFLESLAR